MNNKTNSIEYSFQLCKHKSCTYTNPTQNLQLENKNLDNNHLKPSEIKQTTKIQNTIKKTGFQLYAQQISLEIKKSCLANQQKYMPKFNYLENHKLMNLSYRENAIIFYMTFQWQNDLRKSTMILAVNLFDRYYSLIELTSVRDYNIMVCTILYVAMKYEEIYITEFDNITKAFMKEEINNQAYQQAQKQLFETLEYNIKPNDLTKYFFHLENLKHPSPDESNLINYLVDLSLYQYKMLKYKPSLIALAIDYLIYKQKKIKQKQKSWKNNFITCPQKDLQSCYLELCTLVKTARRRAYFVYQKYATVIKSHLL